MKAAGMDLATTYEAIRISSGNSFVHETESQMILNGSRNISFRMGPPLKGIPPFQKPPPNGPRNSSSSMAPALKAISLFQKLADKGAAPLEISPLMIEIFRDGQRRY